MAAKFLKKIQHLLYHFKLQGQQRNTKSQMGVHRPLCKKQEISGSPSARTAFNLYLTSRCIRCSIGQPNPAAYFTRP